MTEADLVLVREQLSASAVRVVVVDTPDTGRVVVKRQRPSRSAWRANAVNGLARLVGSRLLRAVPSPGGEPAQAIEVGRLVSLASLGVRVPEVLHVDPHFFAIGHLSGHSLVQAIEVRGRAGFEAWQAGLAALVEVHALGGCLSQAFARNFIVTPAGLAMIDFEDDPLIAMTLAEAQARDWLAYLHSTVWLLDRTVDEIRAAFDQHFAQERTSTREAVLAAGRRLVVLRHLPRSRKTWGREVVGLQAVASLFHRSVASPAKMHA